jgi:hypothetical protein
MKFKDYYYKSTIQSIIESFEYIVEGEGFKITDYYKNVASPRNKHFLSDREENGTSKSTLSMIDWDDKKDHLTLFFETTPTYEKNVKIINNKGNVVDGTSNFYTIRIQFEDVSEYLGSKEEFLDIPKKEQIKRINRMIKEDTAKVGSDDCSWYFQSVAENASIMKYAIDEFPKNKPHQTGKWAKKHRGEKPPVLLITKHILECVKIIPFISDSIAKKIREKYEI